jgi:CubicO group peptidase (beta-lactamase class C family)
VDPGAIDAMVAAWLAAGVRPFALTVVRHGVVVASTTWAPYTPEDRVLVYSLSKTFTASAVGIAVGEGLLKVEDRLVDLFPEVTGVGPRAARMQVRHLLSMATGHEEDTYDRLDPDDLTGSFLRLEPEHEPGTRFCYHNAATLMLSAIVQRVTGEPVHRYLLPRLFEPLGIGPVGWLRTGPYDQGFSGLRTCSDAIARLGVLLAADGVFQGRRVLPEGWAREAMTVHIANGDGGPGDATSDWAQGYGYQMWRSKVGWRGDGAFGQLCLVMAEQDLVVAAQVQGGDMQAELDAVWDVLVPGLHDEPLPEDGRVALAGGLEMPLAGAGSGAGAPGVRRAATGGPVELRATGPAAAVVVPGGVVVLDGDELVIDDGSGPVRVPLGQGRWVRAGGANPRVAGSAHWSSSDVFEASVVTLHSPHRLEVRGDLSAGTAELTWQDEPLGRLTLAAADWQPAGPRG